MLNRLKTIQLNYAIICSLAYLIKTLVIQPSFADSVILTCLFALVGFQQFLKFKEPKVTPLDTYKKEMETVLTNMVQAQKVSQKQITDLTSQINNVSSKLKISEHIIKPTQTKPYF